MDSLPRPRRGVAARILASIVVVPMLIAACSGSGGGPLGGGGGDPAAVVKDALAKVAAKDVDGLAGLACAGQADQVRKDFDFGNALASSVPGVDPQAITDSISIDTSGVTVGTPVINGDTATVPVSGTMKMNFDKEKLRPIIKQIMEAQGGGVQLTDDQIDMFLDQMTGSGQGIPMDESLTLKNEGGSWKICDDSSGGGGGPSASITY
jgi:hypothetical protein